VEELIPRLPFHINCTEISHGGHGVWISQLNRVKPTSLVECFSAVVLLSLGLS
jgi:hypothetical protein